MTGDFAHFQMKSERSFSIVMTRRPWSMAPAFGHRLNLPGRLVSDQWVEAARAAAFQEQVLIGRQQRLGAVQGSLPVVGQAARAAAQGRDRAVIGAERCTAGSITQLLGLRPPRYAPGPRRRAGHRKP